MDTVELIYKIGTATAKEILAHLKECNNNFQPSLAKRVDVDEYSQKIFESAMTFEAWSGNFLVGLVAAYFNKDLNYCVYITNVSVLENFMRLGIASRLLMECVGYAIKENFRGIKLEVHSENSRAIDLYRKFNFTLEGINEDFLRMELILSSGIYK